MTKFRFFLLLGLLFSLGCVTQIKTNEDMREAIVHNRVRSIEKAFLNGFSASNEIAYCFPVVPFAAAMNRDEIVLRILDLRLAPSLVNQPNCMGLTALHFAVLNHNLEFEAELLKRGADRTLKDQEDHVADDYRSKPHENTPR